MRAQRESAGEPGHVGKVMLAVQSDEDWVWVAVADDGIGLPDGDRSRLTEPYVTHKPKGTGLGLAIVKKIMEDHGGRVTLDDRPGGQGSIAVLALPRRASSS
jgi:two-component system nitrogen regulation sensor histidine kinase NtrY